MPIIALALAGVLAATAPAAACASLVEPPASGEQWLGCIDPLFEQAMRDVEILSADDMEGRAPSTAGSARARDYIVRRLEAIGVGPFFTAGYQHVFHYEDSDDEEQEGRNVVAVVPGTTGDGKVIVLTAHYDHLGIGRRGIFNGADDNASGVAAILAIAASLRAEPPAHTVILALTDAEEIGFYGSQELVDDDAFPLEDVVLNLNFDMLSKGVDDELFAMGGALNPTIKALIEALPVVPPIKLVAAHDDPDSDSFDDWTNESDQISFHREGIAWLYFANEEHREYHEPTDDFATVQPAFFKAAIATALAALRIADRRLETIAPIPEDDD